MNKITIPLAVQSTFLLLLTVSCAMFTQYGTLESSARNSYRRGDYDKAVLDCAQALKINPEYKKALILIHSGILPCILDFTTYLSLLSESLNSFMIQYFEHLHLLIQILCTKSKKIARSVLILLYVTLVQE